MGEKAGGERKGRKDWKRSREEKKREGRKEGRKVFFTALELEVQEQGTVPDRAPRLSSHGGKASHQGRQEKTQAKLCSLSGALFYSNTVAWGGGGGGRGTQNRFVRALNFQSEF